MRTHNREVAQLVEQKCANNRVPNGSQTAVLSQWELLVSGSNPFLPTTSY